MKITHNKVGQNINTSDTKSEKSSDVKKTNEAKGSSKTSDSSAPAQEGSQATKVELSSRVQDIKKIKEIAKNTPDVDTEKVAKFKQMIAEGKYKVDAKAVADKMVDEHLAGVTAEGSDN